MAFNLTRMTVYALISSLEEDLRSIIKNFLPQQIDTKIIPEDIKIVLKIVWKKIWDSLSVIIPFST